MNRTTRLAFILWFLATTNVADADEPKPPTAAELREAKLYEAIADMIHRRDILLKKFAVVLHGEMTTTGREGGPGELPVICARVVDKTRDFDLRAT